MSFSRTSRLRDGRNEAFFGTPWKKPRKLGMEMQKYLADMCTRDELAQAIQNYWANVTPVQR